MITLSEKPGLSDRIRDLAESVPQRTPKRDLVERLDGFEQRIRAAYSAIAESKPQEPSLYDLRRTKQHLIHAWAQDRTLANLERTHWKRSPWILFDEEFGPSGEDRFVKAYLQRVDRQHKSRMIGSLVHVLLRDYPSDLPTFNQWRQGVANLVNHLEIRSPRILRWRDIHRDHKLFYRDAPRNLAPTLLGHEDIAARLETLGLSGELATGQMASALNQALLVISENRLKQGNLNIAELEALLHFEEDELTRELRFPVQRALIADHLLRPFAGNAIQSELEIPIKEFLLRHLGDPRIHAPGWNGVSEDARAVMLHWLVGDTLKDFFTILDKTALDRHWKYRKEFWTYYHDQRHISAAWVGLGPDAAQIASRWQKDRPSLRYAEFKGRERTQSVLLMRIRNIVVAEWSHNGKCWIWSADNPKAPALYRMNYNIWQVSQTGETSFVHRNPKGGSWQRQVAAYMRLKTGIPPHRNFRGYSPPRYDGPSRGRRW